MSQICAVARRFYTGLNLDFGQMGLRPEFLKGVGLQIYLRICGFSTRLCRSTLGQLVKIWWDFKLGQANWKSCNNIRHKSWEPYDNPFLEKNNPAEEERKRERKNTASADGGPRSWVSTRLTLRSAPHWHLRYFFTNIVDTSFCWNV